MYARGLRLLLQMFRFYYNYGNYYGISSNDGYGDRCGDGGGYGNGYDMEVLEE